MNKALTFGYWQARFPEKQNGEWCRPRSVAGDSVFVFASTTAPLPCASHYGWWQWFETVEEAFGYVRHVLMPEMFELWLVRQDWDKDTDTLTEATGLLNRADKAGVFPDDIPVMRVLIAELDQAIQSDEATMRESLRGVAKRFSERWGRTRTWDLSFDLYCGPEEAGAELYDRGCVGEWFDEEECETDEDRAARERERTEWFETCASAASGDEASGERVANQFEQEGDVI